MSVSFLAGETKVGEPARRAGHSIAASLVTYVYYFTETTFVAHTTDVFFAIAPVTFVIT